MATTAGTRKRTRQNVTPSLIKSETFLFTLVVVGLAIYVPYLFHTSKAAGGDGVVHTNTTSPVFHLPDAFGPPNPPVVVQGPVTAGQAVGGLSTPPGEQRPAPITYIIPYLLAIGRGLLRVLSKLPFLVYRLIHTTVWRPLSYPIAFILAVLRPVTLLLEIIYEVLLRTPLAILSWFITEAIFPLYVFTVMAALIGVAFGYSASHVPKGAIALTERIRARRIQTQTTKRIVHVSDPSAFPDIADPSAYYNGNGTPAYSTGGSFRRRQAGASSRSVTFDDDAMSDVTELESRSSLGLRGVASGSGY